MNLCDKCFNSKIQRNIHPDLCQETSDPILEMLELQNSASIIYIYVMFFVYGVIMFFLMVRFSFCGKNCNRWKFIHKKRFWKEALLAELTNKLVQLNVEKMTKFWVASHWNQNSVFTPNLIFDGSLRWLLIHQNGYCFWIQREKYYYRKSSIRSRPLIQVYSIRGRKI